MKKLIFFDIDGTIVTDNGQKRIIPDSAYQAVRALQQAGHLCFINSGRTLPEIDSMIAEFPMDGYIYGCGTSIIYHGETLFSQTFSPALADRILRDLESCHLEWVLEGSHTVYYSTKAYTTHIGDFLAEHQTLSGTNYEMISPDQTEKLMFDKFCACTKAESDLSRFMDLYQNELDFIDRGNGFYEIIPLGCSKASGMRFLMEYFGIPRQDTIAIGDSTNDLPMLEYAATGIAMGGSPETVCKASAFVTDSILEDGLWNAFHRLKLI